MIKCPMCRNGFLVKSIQDYLSKTIDEQGNKVPFKVGAVYMLVCPQCKEQFIPAKSIERISKKVLDVRSGKNREEG